MTKLRIALAAATVAAFALLGFSGPAQAYPTVTVTISDITVVGGNRIVIRAKANPPVNCAWTVTFSGESSRFVNGPNPDRGTGSSFTRTYDTDRVSETKRGSATARCVYDDTTVPSSLGGAGRLSTAMASALQTASATGAVNLLPLSDDDDSDDSDDSGDSDDSDDGDDDDGGLPDTGGERLLWLLIGLLLVTGGTAVIISSRREGGAAS